MNNSAVTTVERLVKKVVDRIPTPGYNSFALWIAGPERAGGQSPAIEHVRDLRPVKRLQTNELNKLRVISGKRRFIVCKAYALVET